MNQPNRAGGIAVRLFLYIFVVWAALLLAQSLGVGLADILTNLTAALDNPFDIRWTEHSLMCVLICSAAYAAALCYLSANQGKTRDGAEHGSAAWGTPKQVNAMFAQKQNKLLTQNVRLGLDTHKHRRSLNVLVIGGSGAGKSRSYVRPNILEANTNYVITDPKSEVLLSTGGYLKSQGYDIRVLNLVNLAESDGYNPFRYIRDEKDALRLVNNLIQATTPKNSHESDPFWVKSETALLQAIILMLWQEAPEYEQNFSMVMRVLEYAEVKEEDDEYVSPLDLLFQSIEREKPDSVAVRQYRVFKMAAGKTSKSILVSAAVRLAPFNLPQIQAITDRDDTLSVHRKSIEEARTFFDRVTADVTTRLNHLDSHSEELDAVERLRVLHDFYRTGEETEFHVDLRDLMRKGHSFKDAICPNSLEFKKDHFVMGEKFGRVLFLKEYASYIKDSMINELTALNRTMMLSIDVIPVPTDEAVREMQSRLLGVETNVTNWQRRQNNNNNFSAVVPYDLEQQRKETREMLDDLTTRDQRMMFAVVTLVHLADSKEELDSDTDALEATARKHLCQLATLNWQQADGLVTALPLGLRRIDALRTLTTEALAVLMPFKAQEVWDRGGVYYGQNTISKNLIIANRKELLNGNGFVLGVSGSGKSFTAKEEIVSVALATEDDIICLDPESEYRPLIEGLGGEVINISATSRNHINAMDMEQGYGDGDNPVVLKSEFLLSLCEQLMGERMLSAKEKSIIDRCTANVYREYIRGGYQSRTPTLQDFHAELLRQPEPEAKDVALAIELFTEGSLNTFAKPTNVDTDARILCYDIRDLGKQLLPVGMLVVLDSVFNRVIRNRALGRNTWIYVDEIYILFQHEYSANFLFTLWKRVRKYGALCSGITQNIDDLLQSHTARTMLANSEFLVMLNQASTDRAELASLLNISENQLSYITNVEAGRGLIKCGSAIVPFVNSFPKNTHLYRLMSTKFLENQAD